MTTTETRRPTMTQSDSNVPSSVGTQLPCPATLESEPNGAAPGGDFNSTVGHDWRGPQWSFAGRGSTSALGQSSSETHDATAEGGPASRQAIQAATPIAPSPAGTDAELGQSATTASESMVAPLADPALAFAADILDDTEAVWVANSNRLRILTTAPDKPDADGVCRGFGLTWGHPDVARLSAMVDALDQLTKDATKHLEKVMRRHPLHPWVKAQRGLGDKQVARLLAAIGDPYWNTLHDRPRTVSELWAYCGLHVLPASQPPFDAHGWDAGRVQAGEGGGPSHPVLALQLSGAGAAPRRQRGHKANWSENSRQRAWLIANSVVKAGGPYREVYDATKAKYADAVHTSPCVRCGPKGKPAQVGSPLSKAHIHARGLRAISKAVLRDLWVEAKRLHELPAGGQSPLENHRVHAAGRAPGSSGDGGRDG